MIACENNHWPLRHFQFFCKNKFWNPTYILTKLKLKLGKCSKLDFQKLNTVTYSWKNNQVYFFDYIITFRSMKLFAYIADLRLCPYFPSPLHLRRMFGGLMFCVLISSPLCWVSEFSWLSNHRLSISWLETVSFFVFFFLRGSFS